MTALKTHVLQYSLQLSLPAFDALNEQNNEPSWLLRVKHSMNVLDRVLNKFLCHYCALFTRDFVELFLQNGSDCWKLTGYIFAQ